MALTPPTHRPSLSPAEAAALHLGAGQADNPPEQTVSRGADSVPIAQEVTLSPDRDPQIPGTCCPCGQAAPSDTHSCWLKALKPVHKGKLWAELVHLSRLSRGPRFKEAQPLCVQCRHGVL